jgi:hypothetical protein
MEMALSEHKLKFGKTNRLGVHKVTKVEHTPEQQFVFTDQEVVLLQAAVAQVGHACQLIAESSDAARQFLHSSITADRNALANFCPGDVRPTTVGSISKPNNQLGVRKASCQFRYNMGRFRLFFGVEEP